MAITYTDNYHLGKQEDHTDKFDMTVITDNVDKIDEALTGKVDKSTRIAGIDLSANISVDELQTALNIEDGANKTVVDSSLSGSSTNPVQNKKVYEALQGKYNVQANGIPKSDLASDVKSSLSKADSSAASAELITEQNARKAADASIISLLSKNVLVNNLKPENTTVASGVTKTVQKDGSILLDGTASATHIPITNISGNITATETQCDFKKWLPNGRYVAINNVNGARLQIGFYTNGISDLTVLPTAAGYQEFEVTDDYKYNLVRLYILNNSSFNNDIFYPLIVPKEIYDYYNGNISYEKSLMYDTIRYLEEKIDALSQRVSALEV